MVKYWIKSLIPLMAIAALLILLWLNLPTKARMLSERNTEVETSKNDGTPLRNFNLLGVKEEVPDVTSTGQQSGRSIDQILNDALNTAKGRVAIPSVKPRKISVYVSVDSHSEFYQAMVKSRLTRSLRALDGVKLYNRFDFDTDRPRFGIDVIHREESGVHIFSVVLKDLISPSNLSSSFNHAVTSSDYHWSLFPAITICHTLYSGGTNFSDLDIYCDLIVSTFASEVL